jgi:IS605 OrfB family transposase
LFKKAVIPVRLLKPIIGFPRQVEFFKRKGQWLGSLCYNTPRAATIKVTGAIGIDRNSVDNVAILADPQTGTVRRLGFNPARTKESLRGRRKNLQKAGKRRLLSKLRLKHSRRMTHENHRASKSIVDYAATHCRAVTLERLVGVNAVGSKIRRNSETQNWAFAQLESFLVYKCALRGVPVIWVDPAFTSQTCTHCWTRHKPVGKVFRCASCGRIVHKDVNAAFAIGYLGEDVLDGGSGSLNVLPLRCFGDARAGKVGCL